MLRQKDERRRQGIWLVLAFRYFFNFQPLPQEIKLVWKDSLQIQKATCQLSVPSKPFLAEVPKNLNFVRLFSNRSGKVKLTKTNAYIKMSSDKHHLMTFSTKKKMKHDEKLILKIKQKNIDSYKTKKTDSRQRIADIFYGDKSKFNINKIKQHGKNAYETLLDKFSLSNIHSMEKNPKKMSSINSPLKKIKPRKNEISSKNAIITEQNRNEKKTCTGNALDIVTNHVNTMKGSIEEKSNTIMAENYKETKDMIVINSKIKSSERDDRTQRKRYRDKTNSFVMSKKNNNITKVVKSKIFKKYQPELDYRLKKLAEKYTKIGMAKAFKHFQNELGKVSTRQFLKEDKKIKELGIKQKVLKRELKKKLVMDITKQVSITNSYITTNPKPSLSDFPKKTQILLKDIPNVVKKPSKLDSTIMTLDLKGNTEILTLKQNLAVEVAPPLQNNIETQQYKDQKQDKAKLSSPIILDFKNARSADTLIKFNENRMVENIPVKKYSMETNKTALVLNIVGRKTSEVIPPSTTKNAAEEVKNSLKQNSHNKGLFDCKSSIIVKEDPDISKLYEKKKDKKLEKTHSTAVGRPPSLIGSNEIDHTSTIAEKISFQVPYSNEIDKYIIQLESQCNSKKENQDAFKEGPKKELTADHFQNIKEENSENAVPSALMVFTDKTKFKNEGISQFEEKTYENKDSNLSKSKLIDGPKPSEFTAKNVSCEKKVQTDSNHTKILREEKHLLPQNKCVEGNNLKCKNTPTKQLSSRQQQKLSFSLPQNISFDVKVKQKVSNYPAKNISISKTDKAVCSGNSLQGKTLYKTDTQPINDAGTTEIKPNEMTTKNLQISKEKINSSLTTKNRYLIDMTKTNYKRNKNIQNKTLQNLPTLYTKIKDGSLTMRLTNIKVDEKLKKNANGMTSDYVTLKSTGSVNAAVKPTPLNPQQTKSNEYAPTNPSKKETLLNEVNRTNLDSLKKKNHNVVKSCNISGFLIPHSSGLKQKVENKKEETTVSLKISEIQNILKPIYNKNENLPLSQRTFLFPKANNIFLITKVNKANTDEQNIIECLKQYKEIQDIVNVNPQSIINYFPPEVLKNTEMIKNLINSHIFMLVMTKDGINQNQFCNILENISKNTSRSGNSYSIFSDFSEKPFHNSWNDLHGLGNIFLMHGFNKVSFHKFMKPSSIDLKMKAIETKVKDKNIEITNDSNIPLAKGWSSDIQKENCRTIAMSKPYSNLKTSNGNMKCGKPITNEKPIEGSSLENENNSLSVTFKPKVSDEKVPKNPNITDIKNMSSYTKFTELLGEERKLIDRMQITELYDNTLKVHPRNKNILHRANKIINHDAPLTFKELIFRTKTDDPLKTDPIKSQSFQEVKRNRQRNYGVRNYLITIPPRSVCNNCVTNPSKCILEKNCCLKKDINSFPPENNFLNQNYKEKKINKTDRYDKNEEKESSNSLINYRQEHHEVFKQKHTLFQNSKNEEDAVENYMNKLRNKMQACEKINSLPLPTNLDRKAIKELKNVLNNSSHLVMKSMRWESYSPKRAVTLFEPCSEASCMHKGTSSLDQSKSGSLNSISPMKQTIKHEVDKLKATKYQNLNEDISKKSTENKAQNDISSINNHYGPSNEISKIDLNMNYIDKKYFVNEGKKLRKNEEFHGQNISKPETVHCSIKSLSKNNVYTEENETVENSEDSYLDNARVLHIKAHSTEEKGDTSIQLNIKYLVNKSRKSKLGMSNYDNCGVIGTSSSSPSISHQLNKVKKMEPPKSKVNDQIKCIKSGNFKKLITHIKQKERISKVYDIVKNKKTCSFEELTNVIKNNLDRNLAPTKNYQDLNKQKSQTNIPEITVVPVMHIKQGNFDEKKNALQDSQKIKLEENIFENERESKLEFKEVPTSTIMFLDMGKELKAVEGKDTISSPPPSQCDESKKSFNVKRVKTSQTEVELNSEGLTSKLNDSSIEMAKRVEEIMSRKRHTFSEWQSVKERKELTEESKKLATEVSTILNNPILKTDSAQSKEIVPLRNDIPKAVTVVRKKTEIICPLQRKVTAGNQNYVKQAQRLISVLDELPPTYSPLTLPKIVSTEEKADSFKLNVNKENITGNFGTTPTIKTQDYNNNMSLKKPDVISEPDNIEGNLQPLSQNNKLQVKGDVPNENQIQSITSAKMGTVVRVGKAEDVNTIGLEKSARNILLNKENQNNSGVLKERGNNPTHNLPVIDNEPLKLITTNNETKRLDDAELQVNGHSDFKTDQVPSPSRFLKDKKTNKFREKDLVSFSFLETQYDSKALTTEKNGSEHAQNFRQKLISNNYSSPIFGNTKTNEKEIKTDIEVNNLNCGVSMVQDSMTSKVQKETHQEPANKMVSRDKSTDVVKKMSLFVNYARENGNKKSHKEIQTSNSYFKDKEPLQSGKLISINSRSPKKWNKSTPIRNVRKFKMTHSATNQICNNVLNGNSDNFRVNRKDSSTNLILNLERNTHKRTMSLDRFGDSLQSQDEHLINNVFECVPLHCLGLPNKCGNEGFLSKSIRSESYIDPSSFLFNGNSQKDEKRNVTPEAIKFKVSKYRHNKKEDKDVRMKTSEIKTSRGGKMSSITSHLLTSPSLNVKKEFSNHKKNNMVVNKNRKNIKSSVKTLTTRSKYCLNNAEVIVRKKKLPINQFACTTPSTVVHKAKVELSKLKRKHNAQTQGIFEASNHQQTDAENNKVISDENNEIKPNISEAFSEFMIEPLKNPPLEEKQVSKEKLTKSKSHSYIVHNSTSGSLLFEKPISKQPLSSEQSVKPFEDPEMFHNKECYHISNEPLIHETHNSHNKIIKGMPKPIPNLGNESTKDGSKRAELTSLMGSVVTNVKTKLQGIPSSMSKLMAHSQSNKSWFNISDAVKNKVLEDFTITNFQKKFKNLQVGTLQSKTNNTKYFVLGKTDEASLPDKTSNEEMKIIKNATNTHNHLKTALEVPKSNNQNNLMKSKVKKKRVKKPKKKTKIEDMLQIEMKRSMVTDKKKTTPHLAYSDLLNKLYVKYLNSQISEVSFSEKVS